MATVSGVDHVLMPDRASARDMERKLSAHLQPLMNVQDVDLSSLPEIVAALMDNPPNPADVMHNGQTFAVTPSGIFLPTRRLLPTHTGVLMPL